MYVLFTHLYETAIEGIVPKLSFYLLGGYSKQLPEIKNSANEFEF